MKYHLSEKLVIVLNGKGGVGKDTLCEAAGTGFCTRMVSSIEPVKALARQCGWVGDKSAKSRKFLSDLKQLLTEYNDYPTQYLLSAHRSFLESDDEILFVQIREPDQIAAFRRELTGKHTALLIRSNREGFDNNPLGNASDDDVEAYPYDHVFWNNERKESVADSFVPFLLELCKAEGIEVQ